MKKNNFINILVISLLVFKAEIYSQENIRFEHLSDKDGLPSNSITSICQDSIGFLWFGTYNGLVRYDGNNFRIYQSDAKSSDNISLNSIKSLLVDRVGNLWIGTWGGGLNRYNYKKDIFESYQNDPKDPGTISSNMINTICEDRDGNIWICTWGGGVNKIGYQEVSEQNNADKNGTYRRIKFIHFRSDSTNPNSLAGDKVNSIYEDRDGALWIATKFGVSKYYARNNKFINFKHAPDDLSSLSSDNVTSICEDVNGNIWIATWDAGLNKTDRTSGKFIRYGYNEKNKSGISNDKIMRLYRDHSGALWIGTWGGGLAKLVISQGLESNEGRTAGVKANDKFITYSHDPFDPGSISGMSIYCIFEDKTGVLWIGTDNFGVDSFDKRKMQFTHIKSNAQNPNSLNENRVTSMYIDRSDLIWIGTNSGGLNLYDPGKNVYTHFIHDPKNPFSISNDRVRPIYQDKAGALWIGTATGLNRYDPIGRRFVQYFYNPEKPSDTHINSICEDRYGYLWFGNYGEGLVRYDHKGKKYKFYKYKPNDSTSISDNIVWSVFEDSEGILWAGTDNGGLNKYDREHDRFYRYVNNPNDNRSISSNVIMTMFEDSEGELWLGTGNGLNKLVKNRDKSSQYSFIAYTINDGLPSNSIQGILEDSKGNLWVSSSAGITKFNKQTKNIKNYNVGNGLQGNEFSAGSAFMNKRTGVMFFGGTNGYNYFHPDSIKEGLFAPPVVIVDFKIFYKSVKINDQINDQVILSNSIAVTKEIVLSYKNNVITFNYAALQFNSPKDNKYAYMMEGFEKEWNYQGNKSEATYTNLGPGEYTFRVKAANNDGIWNETGTSVKITITPPYWQTFWFKSIMLIVLAGIVFWIYRGRTQARDLASQKKLDAALIKERNLLRTLIDNIPDAIYVKDSDSRKTIANLADVRNIGFKSEADVLGKNDFDMFPKELAEGFFADDQKVVQTGEAVINREEFVYNEQMEKIWLLTSKLPLRDENNNIIGLVGVGRDVTKQKNAEIDREKLIIELQQALADIKTLSGLVPICANCKKIRDDQGYWTQLEAYIQDRSDARFSHSICPDCASKLYPNYVIKKQ